MGMNSKELKQLLVLSSPNPIRIKLKMTHTKEKHNFNLSSWFIALPNTTSFLKITPSSLDSRQKAEINHEYEEKLKTAYKIDIYITARFMENIRQSLSTTDHEIGMQIIHHISSSQMKFMFYDYQILFISTALWNILCEGKLDFHAQMKITTKSILSAGLLALTKTHFEASCIDLIYQDLIKERLYFHPAVGRGNGNGYIYTHLAGFP
ncbi:hypothetical protein ACJX0J_007988 [Zea mays]